MNSVVKEISKLAEQRLGLARLLFSFEIKYYKYDDSQNWKILERTYIDHDRKPLPPINEPMWALFQVYFPEKSVKSMPGLGDIILSASRSLLQAGIITRRNLIESYDLSRKLIDKYPRLTIFLFKMPNE